MLTKKILFLISIVWISNSSWADFNEADYKQKCTIKTKAYEQDDIKFPSVEFMTIWLDPYTQEQPGVKAAINGPYDEEPPFEVKVFNVERIRCLTCDKYLEFFASSYDEQDTEVMFFEYYTKPSPKINVKFDGVDLEGSCEAL